MHRAMYGLARAMALFGGAVLLLLILITCLSILGRSGNSMLHSELVMDLAPGLAQGLIDAGLGPIPGDFELVESGMALIIFAFLPLCQLTGGHARVEIFTDWLKPRHGAVLEAVIEGVFAVVLVIIALQLNEGLASKMRSGQTTLLLQFPVWWAYAASTVAAVLAALVAVYTALVRLYEAATGRTILTRDEGESA